MGIAGGPVTDWRNYDSVYTERYMRTPAHNPEGYAVTSPLAAAKDLNGSCSSSTAPSTTTSTPRTRCSSPRRCRRPASPSG
jgi:hypothetical protein